MKILIVGISVRALAESAVRSNYPVMALDAFGDTDLMNLTEAYSLRRDFKVPFSPLALYQAARTLEPEAVAYTSNLENHPEILGLFEGDGIVIGNPSGVVRRVRHWPSLFSNLGEMGCPVPETVFESEPAIDLERSWIEKPVLSGGGHGIHFLREGQSVRANHMLQQFIHGKACSASFVSNGSECVILGISEQLIGMSQFGVGGFRYCGSILPLPEMVESYNGEKILEQVRRIAGFLTREYCLSGVNGFDFVLDDGRVWLIEVNPRYSASMELIERLHDVPIFGWHVQASIDGILPEFRLESSLTGAKFLGKSILFCERDITVPETRGWLAHDLRDIPGVGERLREGNPICTLFAGGSSRQETLSELIRKAETLKRELYA